jgi:DNA-binding transcriptional MerR regulator
LAHENRKGNKMLFDSDQFSMIQEVNSLREAAARTGFNVSDIQALVECELETSQVLDYITAVLSNRMN